MENFKFTVLSILIFGLLGLGGFWAFSTIESGSTHANNQKIKDLEQKNKELTKETDLLKEEINLLKPKEEENQKDLVQEKIETPINKPQITVSKYQDLINALQKINDSGIILKRKSQGLMVGTIQKFFNIYNNTSKKIDNDYGASLETTVKNFQKAEGLTVSGQVGTNTLKKMIAWLKSH